LTPASSSAIGSVRRSLQINAMLNVVPFSPGSNLDQESSSTAVVNNGSDGAIVDGQDYSVKKDMGKVRGEVGAKVMEAAGVEEK
jgi:hypothetical protein